MDGRVIETRTSRMLLKTSALGLALKSLQSERSTTEPYARDVLSLLETLMANFCEVWIIFQVFGQCDASARFGLAARGSSRPRSAGDRKRATARVHSHALAQPGTSSSAPTHPHPITVNNTSSLSFRTDHLLITQT